MTFIQKIRLSFGNSLKKILYNNNLIDESCMTINELKKLYDNNRIE